jgi:large subunit ribosomal protein L18
MKRRKPYTLKFRRKRKGKTNYKKRLKLLEGNKLRLVIRKSLKYINLQIIQYEMKGDKTLLGVSSKELGKMGWKFNKRNLPSCYLAGLLLSKKAKEKDIKVVVLDCGLNPSTKGSRIYAALKGVLDGGLKVSFSEEVLPDEERLKGKHLVKYAESLKENYEKRFSEYVKGGVDLKKIAEEFEGIKNKILKEG